jgi:hypothetical protein
VPAHLSQAPRGSRPDLRASAGAAGEHPRRFGRVHPADGLACLAGESSVRAWLSASPVAFSGARTARLA